MNDLPDIILTTIEAYLGTDGIKILNEHIDYKINEARIKENMKWLMFLGKDYTNIIHPSTLTDRIKELKEDSQNSV